ncbi:oligopeptide ABC transporter [Klebsiella pneumoniae]|uniref:Oligopeptide ABC transporter n=1 Tax=Klebsiella pneumoniae TaxID=573 RepID=A0A2X3F0M4_KLEPN|nr:oligopeptide ABC transporter [Klebsiella pneumoniae]
MRQALIYGLDRQKLIDVVYQGYGKVAIEPIAPISWALTLKASTLTLTIRPRRKSCWMRPAGSWRRRYPRKDGQRLELTLLVSKKVLNDALIPIAKENWRQIGVLLKPQVVDFNALMRSAKPEITIWPRSAPAPSTTRTTGYGISTAAKLKSPATITRKSIS